MQSEPHALPHVMVRVYQVEANINVCVCVCVHVHMYVYTCTLQVYRHSHTAVAVEIKLLVRERIISSGDEIKYSCSSSRVSVYDEYVCTVSVIYRCWMYVRYDTI